MNTITYYVAPSGNDDWSGSLPDPAGSGDNGPFRTLTAAQKAVRKSRTAGGEEWEIRVEIRGGTYELEDTWHFTAEDAGVGRKQHNAKKTKPIIWAAYDKEKVVISGGRRIAGPWRSEDVNGHSVWVTELPQSVPDQWNFKQLWVNGERRFRPRLPKKGVTTVAKALDANYVGTHSETNRRGTNRFGFAKGEFQSDWRNLQDIEILFYGWWMSLRCGLKEVDAEQQIAHLDRNTRLRLEWSPGDGIDYVIENVFEALTEPGEWYLDRPSGRLFYYPMPGEDPDSAEVVAPLLETLLQVENTGNLRFEGLTFAHNEWQQPSDTPVADQSSVEVPGALMLSNAENCVFDRCRVEHVGSYGVEINENSREVIFDHCVIRDLGAGGAKVWHGCHRNGFLDCEIADGGHLYASGCGVIIGSATGNRIEHCHIHHFYYTGVSVGWTWGYAESNSYGNLVERNHIHDIGLGLLSDMGGIYLLGHAAGTRLRFNHIHGISCRRYGGWCIYTDEGSTDVLIESNLCYDANRNPYNQHYGADNTVRNNIFAYGGDAVLSYGRPESHLGLIFESNILLSSGTPILRNADKDRWTLAQTRFERNIYWNESGPVFFNEGGAQNYATQPFPQGYLAEVERFHPLEGVPVINHEPTEKDWEEAKVLDRFQTQGVIGTWESAELSPGTAELRFLEAEGSLRIRGWFKRSENTLPLEGPVWVREHLEIFLRPAANQTPVLQVGLASDGECEIVWHGATAPEGYRCGSATSVSEDGREWQAELSVPLAPIRAVAGDTSGGWCFLAGFCRLPANRDFASWQAQGHDPEGIVADPLFLDPHNGDFRLQENSPAGQIGFVPFDLTNIGPRP